MTARRSPRDSALTGTNLQCVFSTVRSLADESYNVIVVEDCCAAGSDELHRKEL
jgi:nicotinamidase-related amidase